MPLRYTRTGAAFPAHLPIQPATWTTWSTRRCFHASPRTLRVESNTSTASNHYETLNVHPTATPAEIKKYLSSLFIIPPPPTASSPSSGGVTADRSFYLLSKRHHPDHNPSDPHAPTRFMRLSEAYAVLSHVDKRARYDSDVMKRLHPLPPRAQTLGLLPQHRPGRRAPRVRPQPPPRHLHGPAPSFYRSGGWGAHGAKRRAAHEESTGTGAGFGTHSHSHSHPNPNPGAPPPPPPPPPHRPPPPGGSSSSSSGHGTYRPGTGGMGPGQNPYHHADDDLPHFDRAAHERAQRRGDDRRAHRMAQKMGVNIDQPESQTTMSFFAVAAILAVVVMGPFVISGVWRGPAGGGGKKGNGNGNGNGNAGKGEKETDKGKGK
ncbi:hypothetical protein NEMBOFW57_006079 [Staphylotrichum longicolle]|uniref:J domain-containing protein n=1 Tax=Staphylotrichum longicolle TaxID=669026 RepID=A0AAD4F2N6_9PEZI|nr:hypothetical protein NEMBOFW57_006079 [Staphylotrichum longicolle]